MPFSWEKTAGPPPLEALETLELQNHAILALLLQRIDVEAAPRAGDERLAEALRPIRLKLDLIVELISRLSLRDIALPAARMIEVGLDRIAWNAPEPLEIGAWLDFRLYFPGAYGEAVALSGHVTDCLPGERKGEWQVEATLAPMSETASDAFARLVFAEHRRRLAQRPARIGTRA